MKQEEAIFLTKTGSHAYGTNHPESDLDLRGVFVASKKQVITGLDYQEQLTLSGEDTVVFELKKFLNLLVDQNPNALEVLWSPEDCWVQTSNLFEIIRSEKKNLLSAKAADKFAGYAQSQLMRIKGHNKWINNPQDVKPPQMKDFITKIDGELTFENTVARKSAKNVIILYHSAGLNWIDQEGVPVFKGAKEINFNNPSGIIYLDKDAYEIAHNKWSDYWVWKNNRNEKRSILEEKYGYDTKHASHLIRLLKTGIELFQTGEVNVKRDDYQFLNDIRNGKYSYKEILDQSDELMKKLNKEKIKNFFPEVVDKEVASRILVNIYDQYWDGNCVINYKDNNQDLAKNEKLKYSMSIK